LRSGIYFIQNILTGRIYVGSAEYIAKRKATHLCTLRKGTHHNSYLQRAWNKYGEQAFRFGVLERCSPDKLCEREQWWFGHYGIGDMSKAYNLDTVARSPKGRKMSEATLKKMRAAARKRVADPAHREMLRERAKRQWAEGILKPHTYTPEQCEKISQGLKNSPNRKSTKGRKHSPKTIAKMKFVNGDPQEMSRRAKIRWERRVT